MADIGNSNGPVQGPPIRISCDFRAFNAARPNLLSAFAHFNRSRGQDSVFSEPARSITADPAPAPVRRTEKDIEATPYEAASLHCSGKLAVKPEEAHQEPSTRDGVSQENGASAEINDSALGESLSEPDVQGTPAPPSALIVKFSTTSPGRINGIERQGPIPSNKQSLCQSADQRRKSFNLPNGPQTPLASAQKRRGRPPGSKNKSPFKRSEADWYIAGRENHPAPPQFLYGPREDAHPEESRPRQSGIMRAIWAKRHSNGTDGHWGGPPTDRTVLQRERKTGLQGYAGTPCGRPNSNDPRQAGHQSHPTSASTLPAQASRSANVMHHTVEPGVFNHTNVQAQRAGPSFPSELPALCIKDVALRDVFCAYIYPSLVKARSRHQGTLPSETLDSLYKQVANDTVDRKFRSFLQEYNYRLDKLQRKHIKRYIKNLFASKVRHALPLDQTKPLRSCPTPPRTRINTTPQHIDAAPSTYPLFQTEPSGSQRPFVSSLPKPPPTAFSPELELAFANATLCKAGVDRPYRSTKRGHCDFVREEYISLLDALDSLDHQTPQVYTADIFELRRQLRTRLTEGSDTGDVTVTEERMTAIIGAVFSQRETALTHRKKKNIRAFLVDIAEDAIPAFAQPRLAKPRVGAASDRRRTVTSLLRSRELGVAGPNRTALSTQIAEDIRPWRSWKGASSDVVTVAWAPDSLSYAAGAAAQSDEHDLQYNRACNLLFGDLTSNTICELPDHCVKRLRPKPVSSGPNTAYLIYQACDPVVYKTVTSVQFAPEDGILYTASHDSTVKIWDVTKERPSCQATLDHGAKVTSLEVSHHYPSHLATASETIENSVRVFQLSQGSAYQPLNFSSPRALKHREPKIFPECIRWGLAPGVKHLLLAGFQQWTDHDYSAARQGQICLWDVTTGASLRVRPHASAIFAVAWHPRDEIFVTGGAPGNGPLSYPRSTKSVVRSYDIRSTSSYTHEFECPALDINDVTLHPNSSYVTAGCTDGTTYVWDYRWPDDIMHQLQHGKPLQELGANEGLSDIEHREKADAGVLLSIWGKGASLMYTGSSDGVIKAWDILRAPEDVWVKDIARLPAGVQSGALSPDGMNMLVGDAVGGIHVLSATPFGTMGRGRGYHPAPIDFRYAHNTKQKHDDENPGTEGIQAANQKLQSGDIVLHPLYGVDRGPNYQLLANSSPRESQQQVFPPGNTDQQGHLPRIQALISARKAQIQAVKQALKPLDFTFGPPVSFVAGRHSSASASKPTITQSTPRSARPTDRRSLDPDADDLIYVSTFPSTGGAVKRKRPQHSAPACPSTPSSKRIKTEIITPSKSQSKHPQLARGPVEIEVIDLTGGGEGEDKPTRAVEREPEDGKKEEENLLSWADWVDEDWWWPEGC